MNKRPSELSAKLIRYDVVIVGKRQDDLPCHECDEYKDTLIVKVSESTYDVCHHCAAKLGLIW
jgi:hypothetical protein